MFTNVIVHNYVLKKMFGINALRDPRGSKQGTWSENQNMPTGLRKAVKDKPIKNKGIKGPIIETKFNNNHI